MLGVSGYKQAWKLRQCRPDTLTHKPCSGSTAKLTPSQDCMLTKRFIFLHCLQCCTSHACLASVCYIKQR